MNDTRGIELDRGSSGVDIVPPSQGGEDLILDIDPGLRAVRFTPGCHISGFQPSYEDHLLSPAVRRTRARRVGVILKPALASN